MKIDVRRYWDVDPSDIRAVTLQKLVRGVSAKAFETESTDEIIKLGIDALKNFKITDLEREALQNAIFGQNSFMQEAWIRGVRDEVAALGADKVVLLSLGCGDESVFERAVEKDIKKHYPTIVIEWLGVDVGDYRSPSSFFADKPFKIVGSGEDIVYRSLVDSYAPVVLFGRWSYHHLGINFSDFMGRCKGVSKIILVEEPVTLALWTLGDYRVLRIAYDLLGNFIVSRAWAKEFMKDASKFKISYLFKEDLPPYAKLTDFPSSLPETSLVVI